jgi:hypothetical protein
MRRGGALRLSIVLFLLTFSCGGGGGGDDQGSGNASVKLAEIASLAAPLDLTSAPGDARRLFVAE